MAPKRWCVRLESATAQSQSCFRSDFQTRLISGVRVMAQHNNETRDQDSSAEQSASFWQTLTRGFGFGSHGHYHGGHHQSPGGNPDPGTPPPPTVEFRSIDGSGNNLANPQFNSANSD